MSKKLFVFPLVVVFIAATSLFGVTTGKISGVVKDAQSGDALPGVNVVIEGTTMGAASDIEGNYFILNIPPGSYTLRASMMGYKTLSKTEVLVQATRTIIVDFALETTTIVGEEVTVVAEREIVPLDVSSSQIIVEGEKIIETIPVVRDIQQFFNTQAGIENMVIRGGGLHQTGMIVDGFNAVDLKENRPTLESVNLSQIKEISVLTGGFNAEYGNVRSGMISVVTKEGGNRYHGSVDFRYSPAAMKHFGASNYGPDHYYTRAYMDDAVCWTGTDAGGWDEYTQSQNPYFQGWNVVSEGTIVGEDSTYYLTPQECQRVWKFRRFIEGGDRSKTDGDKPDYNVDASFSGPMPFIGKYLGNLRFFASHRNRKDMYVWTMGGRDAYTEENTILKLVSHPSPNMKLVAYLGRTYLKGALRSTSPHVGSPKGYGYTSTFRFITDNNDIMQHKDGMFWYPAHNSAADLTRNKQGFSFTHTLSPSTYYELRLDHMTSDYWAGPYRYRDYLTPVLKIGNVEINEAPLGHYGLDLDIANDGWNMGGHSSPNRMDNFSRQINFRGDLVSQVNTYNQIKLGLEVNHLNMDINYFYSLDYIGPSDMNEYQRKYIHFTNGD